MTSRRFDPAAATAARGVPESTATDPGPAGMLQNSAFQRAVASSGDRGAVAGLALLGAGNGDMERALGESRSGPAAMVQRQADPQSATGQVEAAVGVPVSQPALTASAVIAAGQTLSHSAGEWVHTVEPVTTFVSVSGQQLSISFDPQLVITADSGHWWVPDPDIYLTRAWFDFATGEYGVSMSAPNYAMWGGAAKATLDGVGTLFAKMPARMRSGGYDPFADPNLVADLRSMAQGLAGGGGGAPPRLRGGVLTAEVTLSGEVRRDIGPAAVVLPAGTRLSLSVRAGGDMPTDAAGFAGLELESVGVRMARDAEVRLQVAGEELPVVWVSQATLSHGGHLAMSYVLINEALDGVLRALVRAAAVPELAGYATGDPRSPASHAVVDKLIGEHLEPLVKQAVLTNRDVVPGLDLARALGIP